MSIEPDRIKNYELERYFFDVPAECPYHLPTTAIYRQACFGPLPDNLMEYFLINGYRRNGNIIYTMVCESCNLCVPIRLSPTVLEPNRNQKRVLQKNEDIDVEVGDLLVTDEKISLLDDFFQQRYPLKGNNPYHYYSGFFMNTVTNSFELRYKIGNRLVGVAVIDVCGKSINAVYFYFDPEENKRSLGTFNVLYLVDLCRRHKLDFLYLGYWVDSVKAMSYKSKFKPHQILSAGQWRFPEKFFN